MSKKPVMSTKRGNVLVLRALGLGDFLTGLPALRALEAAFPGHERVLAAPEWLRPLVELTGWRLAPFDLDQGGRPPVEGVEVAVNLHGKGPQSHRALLALWPDSLLAFRNDEIPASAQFPRHRTDEHEVARWCRLLAEFGILADPGSLDLEVPMDWAPEELQALGGAIGSMCGATVIHPGAASPARRWPPERWAEVATGRRKRGDTVLLTGSRDEMGLCEQVRVAAELPGEANLAGKTGLLGLARVVSAARLALSGDTGFAHLATAAGTPSVVLFGPVSPALWGPPRGRPQHVAIWKGGTGDPHAARADSGLIGIGVPEVLAAIEGVLEARFNRHPNALFRAARAAK